METDEFMSVSEVAKLFKVSPFTVRGWLRDAKLPRTRAGGRVLIARSSLEGFLRTTTPKNINSDEPVAA